MTYFGFLALFLGIPIAVLGIVARSDSSRNVRLAASLRTHSATLILLLHVALALIYTTPWDNYLVATRVWWYDPSLVTGMTIGWVPIEEYTFFVVQPIFSGLWLLYLARHLRLRKSQTSQLSARLRYLAPAVITVLWLASVGLLVSGWERSTYLGLELVWALPPIILQLAFGADILWHYRRLVLLALVLPTLYLSAADAIAIQAGTWTINPAQSLNLYLFDILPLEELLFFLLTNTLVVFGITLSLAQESQQRLRQVRTMLTPAKRRPAGNAD